VQAAALGEAIPEDGYKGEYISDLAKSVVAQNPKITDQEIEAKLRALPGTGTVGGKMYSNR
jgi:arginyl-tRNA synthetase